MRTKLKNNKTNQKSDAWGGLQSVQALKGPYKYQAPYKALKASFLAFNALLTINAQEHNQSKAEKYDLLAIMGSYRVTQTPERRGKRVPKVVPFSVHFWSQLWPQNGPKTDQQVDNFGVHLLICF